MIIKKHIQRAIQFLQLSNRRIEENNIKIDINSQVFPWRHYFQKFCHLIIYVDGVGVSKNWIESSILGSGVSKNWPGSSVSGSGVSKNWPGSSISGSGVSKNLPGSHISGSGVSKNLPESSI